MRAPTERECESVVSCVEAGFDVVYTNLQRSRFCAGLELDRALVAVVDDTVVGTLSSHLLEQTVVGPEQVPCVAVTDVTVLPDHRRRGIFDDLMRRFLVDAHERGDVLAVLAASAADLYGRYGFGVATWSQSGRLQRAGHARSSRIGDDRAAKSSGAMLVTLAVDEALEALPAVFEVVRCTRPGELSRPRALFEELFDELSPGERRNVVAAVTEGTVDGYAIYDRTRPTARDPGGRVRVVEVTATSPEARHALWDHLCALGPDEIELDQLAPCDIGAAARRSGRRPEVATADRTWNRLVDVGAALAMRRYRGPGDVVLDVADELCPWNAGSYRLSVDEVGRVAIDRTTKAPDLTLGAGALATIYSGSASTPGLAVPADVIERTAGALDHVSWLFSSAVTPFCTALC